MFGMIRLTILSCPKRYVIDKVYITDYLLKFCFRDRQDRSTITVCPTCTIVGVPNGMATTIMRIMEVKRPGVAITVAADAQTTTPTFKKTGKHREDKFLMLNLRPSYLLVKQPAKASHGR